MRLTALRRVALALALLAAAGCSVTVGAPHPHAYTDDELRDRCLRTGGWWRGELIAGFCEYQSPGFL